MSVNIKHLLATYGGPSLENIARSEEKLDPLVRHFKQVLAERAAIKDGIQLLQERIEFVNSSPEYRTRRARAKRLEELNVRAVHEVQYQSDLNSRTAKAWAIRKKVHEAVEQHHRTVFCRALCEIVQYLLPRELRDMIYGFLLEQKTQNGDRRRCQCFVPGVIHSWHNYRARYLSVLRCRTTMPKHLCSSEALGEATFRELGEMWYQTTSPTIGTASSIAPLLQDDMFHAGIIPASHLRQIHLQIMTSINFYDYRDSFPKRWSICSQWWIDGIKYLRLLNRGCVVSVDPHLYAVDNNPDRTRVYLEILRRLLVALSEIPDAGNRITVCAHEKCHGISGMFDRKSVTLDEFRKRVQKFLQAAKEVSKGPSTIST